MASKREKIDLDKLVAKEMTERDLKTNAEITIIKSDVAKKRQRHSYSVNVDEELAIRIENYCKKTHLAQSAFFRMIAAEWLDKRG